LVGAVVETVEISLVAALADTDESGDLPADFGDERGRPAPPALCPFLHRQRHQLLARERVRIRGLPRLNLDPGDRLGILGCGGANHRREPTLPP